MTAAANGSETPQELADAIAKLGKEGDREGASALALRLLTLRPAHRRALRALTIAPRPEVDVLAGWYALAKREPGDLEANHTIASLEMAARRFEAALGATEQILAVTPDDAAALGIAFAAHCALHDASAAAAAWRALQDCDPKEARARLGICRNAPAAYAKLIGALTRDDAGDQALLEERRRLEATLVARAYAAEVNGDMIEAMRAYRYLLDLNPEDLTVRASYARTRRAVRAKLADQKERDSAVSAAKFLLEVDPFDRDAAACLAADARSRRDWPALIAIWDEYFAAGGKRTPDFLFDQADAAANIGLVIIALDRWSEATRAGAPGPEYALSHLKHVSATALAQAMDSSDWNGAVSLVLARAAAFPDGNEETLFIARQLQATVAMAKSDEEPPLDALRALRRLQPNDLRGATRLGRALLRTRHDEEALDLWVELAEKAPTILEPWLQVARAARRLRRPAQQAVAARHALALEPDHAEASALAEQADAV